MHRGQVRAGDPSLQPEALAVQGERFDVARQRIVTLVAVQVHSSGRAAPRSRRECEPTRRLRPWCARSAECRRRRHPHVQRAFEIVERTCAPEQAVLWKGHQLQIEVGRDPLPDFEQRLDRQQARVADVRMGADREQTLATAQSPAGERPFDQCLLGQQGLELAPQRDAFEQRPDRFTRGRPWSVASM